MSSAQIEVTMSYKVQIQKKLTEAKCSKCID